MTDQNEMKIRCAHDAIVPVNELKPHPKNRNKHPVEQIERLAKILEYQGWRYCVKVSKQSGFVTAGHGRIEAAKHLGWDKVPVNYQDYDDDAQEYADVQADNAIASWAELDLSSINFDITDLGPDFDIDLLGIENFVLEPAEKLDPQCDEDEVPEHVEPKAKLGDIYKLGNHRLMCGDSTSIDAVEKLMDGEKADMVFTDPPYGVDYDGGAKSKRRKIENDESTDIYDGALPMLYAFTQDKAALYIWHAAGYADMASKLASHDFSIRSQIIWNKNQAQFGALSAQYKQKHEPCFYCFKKGCAPNWYGPTNEVTVWDMKRESKNEFHPTQKPVELSERALTNSSKEKDRVLDLFGGSGSTLIACEKTNRKCFMMELDPHYIDVIIARWEKYTGKKAELLSDDKEEA